MNYVGVDLHKEQSWFYGMDCKGTKIFSKSIPNTKERLHAFFATIPRPFQVAVESTYNWYFFVDIGEQYAREIYLANSFELKAFAKRNKKTDKIDARLIADVLRKGYLPTVTIPDQQTRRLKELLRFRMQHVQDRSRVIFRLKNLLDKLGEDSNGNFTTAKRLETITTNDLPEEYRNNIAGYVRTIRYLSTEISTAEKVLVTHVTGDPDINRLMTIPGLSFFSASLVKSEIIDINRFQTFDRLCAYAGLAPRVHQSANKKKYGPLNVNRRKYLQWILFEVVLHFAKGSTRYTEKFEHAKAKKGFITAKVILARDMLKIIYHVLKDKQPFHRCSNKEQPVRHMVASTVVGV